MTPTDSKQTILIVDDTPLNLQVLSSALNSDYSIKIANNGFKALELAETGGIDLILLDIMMPEMDGYEVCRRLKEQPETKSIPIIFITAKGENKDEMLGLKLGAADYIAKPFYIPIVLVRIENLLRLRRQTKLLEELASIDGLTEISNRRAFDERLQLEWQRAGRQNEPLSLLMMDVDNFKRFNDSAGHAAGDHCLRAVAGSLDNTSARGTDFVARYGGEEFVAILPNTDEAGASKVAEMMRSSVEALALAHPDSDTSAVVTISIGCATTLPDALQGPEQLLLLSDQGLYLAKGDGRNCCRTTYTK